MLVKKASAPSTIKECSDVEELGIFLGVNQGDMLKYLYSKAIKYRTFEVDKKNGKKRTIVAPVKKLKHLQYKVKEALEVFYNPKLCNNGFIKDRNVVTNAQPHLRKEFVLNIDLDDYFGSIKFGRVKRLFESYPLELNHSVATVLAHICCYNESLPQGAPTSPIVSNMITYKLDNKLRALALSCSCSYSRYADDITFSFTNRERSLPREVAFYKNEELVLGEHLKTIIKDNGFSINDDKTRMQHRTQRQSVTNITVNEKVNVNRRFIRATSAMINALIKYGPIKAEEVHFSKYHKGYKASRHKIKLESKPGKLFIQKVRGRLNFIRMVRGETCNVWRKLMYQYTVAIEQPNEDYNKNWLEFAADSTLIIHACNDDNTGQGSGFVLDGVGIITNEHVVRGTTKENIKDALEIHRWDDVKSKFIFVELIAMDKDLDLAILDPSIHAKSFNTLKVEPNPDYKKGTTVHTIGYPNYNSGEEPTYIEAKIIGKSSFMGAERIKIDSNIRHGNSGGVVLNTDGKVVGIVSNGNAIGADTKNNSSFIPIETLLKYRAEHELKSKIKSAETAAITLDLVKDVPFASFGQLIS
ncbi:MAG: reverse transcriptase domain-containing protein [Litorilituus sp.]|nr:reverse transcriptase domain-containing protein [Litorilituus sp.]